MTSPDLSVWLVAGYALALLGAAWAVDLLGSRSARRSMNWRHADFVYHDDVDGWRCHEDQWLWPTAFDPDKRVVRYEGAHAICGRCPSKSTCSPTPGPREITRPVDPWPYSEAGRFHRGVALVIACVGAFLSMSMMTLFHGPDDLVVLGTTLVVVAAGTYPLARHLWSTPDNAPAALPHIGSAEHEAARRSADTGPAPVKIGSRPTGYRSVREAAEAIVRARAERADGGSGTPTAVGSATGAADVEPSLRRVAALRTRGRSTAWPGTAAPGRPETDESRRTWSSAWKDVIIQPAPTTSPKDSQ